VGARGSPDPSAADAPSKTVGETTRIFKICGARLHVGEGTIFVCKLSALHTGRHSDDGKSGNKFPFFIMWEGDMRAGMEEPLDETLNPT